MKFRVTIYYDYEVSDADADEEYGTADPVVMAAIDETSLRQDPGAIAADLADVSYTVDVRPWRADV
jgi:hypothetical protein